MMLPQRAEQFLLAGASDYHLAGADFKRISAADSTSHSDTACMAFAY